MTHANENALVRRGALAGPGFLSPAEEALLADLIGDSVSPATFRAYESDWKAWVSWCAARGDDPVPARPRLVGLWIAEQAVMTRPDGSPVYAAATIGRRAAAVSTLNAVMTACPESADLTPRLGQYPDVRGALAGMRRRRKGIRPDRADPLLLEDMRLLCAAIAASGTTWSRRVRARRDAAVVTALMAGAYRRSELAAHVLGDVTYQPGVGLHMRVPFSKTDQEGAGLVKVLPAGDDPLTCPRCAMLKWISVVAAWDSAGRPGLIRLLAAPDEPGHVCREPRSLPSGGAPLLRGIDRSGRLTAGGLSGHAVNDIVKGWWEAAGPGDGRRITSHSGRVGFVTEGFRAGADANEIAQQTGHRTTRQVEEYRREHVPEAGNAVTRIVF